MIVFHLTSVTTGQKIAVSIGFFSEFNHDRVMEITNAHNPFVGLTDCMWLVPGTWDSN